jgi:chemotaxis family two-component system response regulator Rcp1
MSPKTMVPAEILLVEDSPSDIRLTEKVMADARIANNLHVVRDGVEAIAFVRGEGAYESMPQPDLVLLDLNLPRIDGREVLHTIKSDPELHRMPVIVLTTSREEQDVLRSYELQANSYISKPIDLGEFIDVVRSIEGYWLNIVRLPRHGAGGAGAAREIALLT